MFQNSSMLKFLPSLAKTGLWHLKRKNAIWNEWAITTCLLFKNKNHAKYLDTFIIAHHPTLYTRGYIISSEQKCFT